MRQLHAAPRTRRSVAIEACAVLAAQEPEDCSRSLSVSTSSDECEPEMQRTAKARLAYESPHGELGLRRHEQPCQRLWLLHRREVAVAECAKSICKASIIVW